MAQFRLEIKIHKRGADGSGIMQKAGYNARVALYDDEIGLRTKVPSKSKVEQLAYEKIYLPENASNKFLNRETLWNEVQNAEKPKGSQMAREFIGNLPNELPLKTQIAILDEFAKYLTNQGMICDAVLHFKKGNVGFHILCPMRKLKANGEVFAPKRANAYVCQNSEGKKKLFIKVGDINKYNEEHSTDFKRVPLIDKDGHQKMRIRKGRKPTPEWERKPIDLTGWNERVDQKSFFDKIKQKDTQVEKWRSKLCEIGNKYLNESNKWIHLSYKRQGLDILPTKHEGARVRWLENKEQQRIDSWNKDHPENQKQYEPVTDIRKYNTAIKQRNELMQRIKHQINAFKEMLKNKLFSVFQTNKRQSANALSLANAQMNRRNQNLNSKHQQNLNRKKANNRGKEQSSKTQIKQRTR